MCMTKKLIIALVAVSIFYWYFQSHDGTEQSPGPEQSEQVSSEKTDQERISPKEVQENTSEKRAEETPASIVLNEVNELRKQKKLPLLSLDPALTQAAQKRAVELGTLFSHTRPNGTTCFTVLDEMNISYRSVAENVAQGQRSPQEVVQGWRNSQGHYRNMMGTDFRKIGIGYDARTRSWVQLFKD